MSTQHFHPQTRSILFDSRIAFSASQRTSRRVVHSQLQHLRGGCLKIIDGLGTNSFGDPGIDPLMVTIQVKEPSFYQDIIWGGNLGVAEAYLRGKWTCDDLPTLIRYFCRNLPATSAMNSGKAQLQFWLSRLLHLFSHNSVRGSQKNIASHYDLSNDFFGLFLDPTMMYSSAYFANDEMSLEQASLEKLDRVCRQLDLQQTDHVLEIGTGWGGWAIHAARNFGCRITTTTISQQQYELAQQRISEAGLSDRITLLLEDYRQLPQKFAAQGSAVFDKIVSIEMIEAVGHEYLPKYFETAGKLLKPGGKFLVQAITIPDHRYEVYRKSVDFIQKYIFPGGHLPSIAEMQAAVTRQTNLLLVRQEDFGHSYALTLREWRRRFFERLDEVRDLGFDERFIRMWDYYFSYCEGAFLEQAVGVSHLVWQRPLY